MLKNFPSAQRHLLVLLDYLVRNLFIVLTLTRLTIRPSTMSNNRISFANEANFSESTGNIFGSNNASTTNSHNATGNGTAAHEPRGMVFSR